MEGSLHPPDGSPATGARSSEEDVPQSDADSPAVGMFCTPPRWHYSENERPNESNRSPGFDLPRFELQAIEYFRALVHYFGDKVDPVMAHRCFGVTRQLQHRHWIGYGALAASPVTFVASQYVTTNFSLAFFGVACALMMAAFFFLGMRVEEARVLKDLLKRG